MVHPVHRRDGTHKVSNSASTAALSASAKTRLDAEDELVKIGLWLDENGADVNAMAGNEFVEACAEGKYSDHGEGLTGPWKSS